MDLNKVYITSDLHYAHRNVITFSNRPFENTDEMDEALLKQFDELPDDAVIIHNGDLFLNSRMDYEKLKNYYIPRMKGNSRKIWNIMGNHDKTAFKYVKNCPYKEPYEMYISMGFDRVYMLPILFEGKFLLSHEPVYLKPGSNLVNVYGHTHDCDIDENYFNRECENWAMMKRVKAHPELTKQTILDIDTSIKPLGLEIDLSSYFNVCWDKHHRILKWSEVTNHFKNLRKQSSSVLK